MEPVHMDRAHSLVKKYFDRAKELSAVSSDETITEKIIELADDNEPFFNSDELSTQEYSDMFSRVFVCVQEVE